MEDFYDDYYKDQKKDWFRQFKKYRDLYINTKAKADEYYKEILHLRKGQRYLNKQVDVQVIQIETAGNEIIKLRKQLKRFDNFKVPVKIKAAPVDEAGLPIGVEGGIDGSDSI